LLKLSPGLQAQPTEKLSEKNVLILAANRGYLYYCETDSAKKTVSFCAISSASSTKPLVRRIYNYKWKGEGEMPTVMTRTPATGGNDSEARCSVIRIGNRFGKDFSYLLFNYYSPGKEQVVEFDLQQGLGECYFFSNVNSVVITYNYTGTEVDRYKRYKVYNYDLANNSLEDLFPGQHICYEPAHAFVEYFSGEFNNRIPHNAYTQSILLLVRDLNSKYMEPKLIYMGGGRLSIRPFFTENSTDISEAIVIPAIDDYDLSRTFHGFRYVEGCSACTGELYKGLMYKHYFINDPAEGEQSILEIRGKTYWHQKTGSSDNFADVQPIDISGLLTAFIDDKTIIYETYNQQGGSDLTLVPGMSGYQNPETLKKLSTPPYIFLDAYTLDKEAGAYPIVFLSNNNRLIAGVYDDKGQQLMMTALGDYVYSTRKLDNRFALHQLVNFSYKHDLLLIKGNKDPQSTFENPRPLKSYVILNRKNAYWLKDSANTLEFVDFFTDDHDYYNPKKSNCRYSKSSLVFRLAEGKSRNVRVVRGDSSGSLELKDKFLIDQKNVSGNLLLFVSDVKNGEIDDKTESAYIFDGNWGNPKLQLIPVEKTAKQHFRYFYCDYMITDGYLYFTLLNEKDLYQLHRIKLNYD
jgi:hypothetical protein